MIENLPDGWRVEKLEKLCKFMNGYAFSSKDYVEFSNVINIRMSNIRPNASFDYLHNIKYLPEEYSEKYKQFQLDDNDIILAMTDMGKAMKILGVPTEVKKPDDLIFLLNQRVGKLFDFDLNKISTSYIKKVLSTQYIHDFYKRLGGGGLQINLSKINILSAQIPIPPLPQQEKIVKVLDISSALIEKQKELIQNYDLFLKSKFIEMFGDPIKNPMGWKVVKLEKFTTLVSSGSTPKGGQSSYLDNGEIRFIRSQNVRMNQMKYDGIYFISEEVYIKMKRTQVQYDDVLLNITGASIGRTAIYKDTTRANVNQHVCIIRLNEQLNNIYLNYFLSADSFQNRILANQSGATREALNFSQIKQFNISYPPLKLQNKFASIVEKIELIKEKENKKLESLQTLHDSLMQKAFRGEIK